MTSSATPTRRTPRDTRPASPALTLIAVCFGLFMVGLDSTVVHIANPAIQADLGASFAELQWVINSYLLGLAVLLILGGKLGDRWGRKRMYLSGVAVFGIASVVIGLIGSIEGVIVFRVVQGISAAMLMPQTIALLRATFPREKFGMAVGIWGGVSSVAIAAGPLVSGILVEQAGWQWVFYINAPIAVIAVIFGMIVLRETESADDGPFDLLGVVLLGVFLFGIVFGVVQAQSWGWGSAKTLGTLIGSFIVFGAFLVTENRIRNPLLPLGLFRSRDVGIGGLVFFVNFFAILGVTFLITLFLLNTMGYSTVEAGLRMLPMSAFAVPAAPIGAALTAKSGARRVAALGLGLMTIALALLTLAGPDTSYWYMAVPFVILAFGSGFAIPSGAELIVGSAPVRLAGVASGFQTTCIQVGGAIGTAVLSSIVAAKVATSITDSGAPADLQEPAAAGVPITGLPQINDAFVSGLHIGLVVAAVLTAVVAVLVLTVIREEHTAEEIVDEQFVDEQFVDGELAGR